MPRQPRTHAPSLSHHLMARGIEGYEIFQDATDREDFFGRFLAHLDAPRLYDWVLKSNHTHLFLQSTDMILPSMMRRLLTVHAVWFNLAPSAKGLFFRINIKTSR